ncbi:MAG: DUF420 domain-containing protein [Myxococcota bacterium]
MSASRLEGRGPIATILAVSAVAIAFLFWLIYFKGGAPRGSGGYTFLPALNATLNALSAISVTVGLVFVRRRQHQAHGVAMMSAFAFSTAFLLCYITYYWLHGNTVFTGQGIIRPIYFAILISHILLSVVALPMILTTFFFSLTKQYSRHTRLARFTYPIWLYVSVTGVVVFFLVKNFA